MGPQRADTVGHMKLRSMALVLFSFGLGLAVMWFVATQTHWLRFVQKRTEYHAIDSSDLPWRRGGHQGLVTYDMKFFGSDPHTGAIAMLVRYPAGQVNPPHTHSVGNAMYVLQGKLVTNRGTFGPGTYVWFPPDVVVSHGASPGEDVVVLFMTHDSNSTDYVNPAAHGGSAKPR